MAFLDRLLRRRQAYRAIFLDSDAQPNQAARTVLADLRRFCRASSSSAVVSPVTKSIDPMAMAMAEGRREVWNRIQAHLHLDDAVIANLQESHNE